MKYILAFITAFSISTLARADDHDRDRYGYDYREGRGSHEGRSAHFSFHFGYHRHHHRGHWERLWTDDGWRWIWVWENQYDEYD